MPDKNLSYVLHAARQFVEVLRREARQASADGMSHVSDDINARAELINSAIRSVEKNT